MSSKDYVKDNRSSQYSNEIKVNPKSHDTTGNIIPVSTKLSVQRGQCYYILLFTLQQFLIHRRHVVTEKEAFLFSRK